MPLSMSRARSACTCVFPERPPLTVGALFLGTCQFAADLRLPYARATASM